MHSLFFSNPYFNQDSANFAKANVFEDEQTYLIEIEAPGFSKDDFTIAATTNSLQVKANRTIEIPEGFNLYRQESQATSLKREFRFRRNIDADAVEAKSSNGILSLHIPKKQVRLVEVNAV